MVNHKRHRPQSPAWLVARLPKHRRRSRPPALRSAQPTRVPSPPLLPRRAGAERGRASAERPLRVERAPGRAAKRWRAARNPRDHRAQHGWVLCGSSNAEAQAPAHFDDVLGAPLPTLRGCLGATARHHRASPTPTRRQRLPAHSADARRRRAAEYHIERGSLGRGADRSLRWCPRRHRTRRPRAVRSTPMAESVYPLQPRPLSIRGSAEVTS